MGADETARIVEMPRKLARDHAILPVERDMDAPFGVALSVMVNGRVLESGPRDSVRWNRVAQMAYRGTEEVVFY